MILDQPNRFSLANWLGASWIYPNVCQLCESESATAEEGYVGPRCRLAVQWITPPYCQRCGMPFDGSMEQPFECSNCQEGDFAFSSARSAVAAKGPVLEAIHRYKYHGARWFEPFFATLLSQRVAQSLPTGSWDGLIPVPLHPGKLREREFNQALHLCQVLSAATQLPIYSDLLKRSKATETQTHLTRSQRQSNVTNAFHPNGPEAMVTIQGGKWILVDDVFTTGSTTNACATVLRQSGAQDVAVWTLARGL